LSNSNKKNTKSLIIVTAIIFTMIGLTFASVPLYRIFCQVTGWGGTTQRIEKNTSETYNRVMTVKFNADINRKVPWIFKPKQHEVKVKVGEEALIYYYAENKSDKIVTGRSIHNVTPLKAGQYFIKTQCFCFSDQTLKPGEKVDMPVSFYIDPSIMEDRSMDDINTITLSYTFFKKNSEEMEKAVKKLYNNENN